MNHTRQIWHQLPNETHSAQNMVQGDGFEPSKLTRQIYSLIPLAAREPLPKTTEIFRHTQSTTNPFSKRARQLQHSNIQIWSWREESNPRPADYKSAALPTELRQLFDHCCLWRQNSSESFSRMQHLNNNLIVFLDLFLLPIAPAIHFRLFFQQIQHQAPPRSLESP